MRRTPAIIGSAGLAITLALSGALALPAGASSKSGSLKKELKAIEKEVKSLPHSTYKAKYHLIIGSKTETVTFEQSPPKSAVGTTAGSFINTGTSTIFCTSAGTCIAESGATADPLGALTQIIDPAAVEGYFSAAKAEASQKGYSLKFSTGKYAGLKSQCIKVSGNGSPGGTYCVSSAGYLDYLSSPSATLTLVSFSKHPPASDFAAPAGATVETLPAGVSGVSIP